MKVNGKGSQDSKAALKAAENTKGNDGSCPSTSAEGLEGQGTHGPGTNQTVDKANEGQSTSNPLDENTYANKVKKSLKRPRQEGDALVKVGLISPEGEATLFANRSEWDVSWGRLLIGLAKKIKSKADFENYNLRYHSSYFKEGYGYIRTADQQSTAKICSAWASFRLELQGHKFKFVAEPYKEGADYRCNLRFPSWAVPRDTKANLYQAEEILEMVKNFNDLEGKWLNPSISTAKGGAGVNLQWTPDKAMLECLLGRMDGEKQVKDIQFFFLTEKLAIYMTNVQAKKDERARKLLAKRLEEGKVNTANTDSKESTNNSTIKGLNIERTSDNEGDDVTMVEEDDNTVKAKAQDEKEKVEPPKPVKYDPIVSIVPEDFHNLIGPFASEGGLSEREARALRRRRVEITVEEAINLENALADLGQKGREKIMSVDSLRDVIFLLEDTLGRPTDFTPKNG